MIDFAITRQRYREVLRVCLPLVLSMSATTVMEFTDRVFLANYSLEAISAVVPAGITAYLFLAFFGGVAGYVQVFIAQYYGAGRYLRIGAVLWQGLFFCLVSGIFLALLPHFAARPIFALAGHPPEVAELERVYFTLLCRGAVLHLLMTCLAAFFSGRGLTRPVMIFFGLGMAVNIPLDYCLIFGLAGLPGLGIAGAALATIVSWACVALLLALFAFTPENIRRFALLSAMSFEPAILRRLLRYGLPGALQFTLDILAFTLFILLVGRIGKMELAVTNIILSINALAFMPSMGVSQGVSALVGQALGRRRAEKARHTVRASSHLLLVYILLIDCLFLAFPEPILSLFLSGAAGEADRAHLLAMGIDLLHIVCAYLLFDALYMVLAGALRGAGDTRFLMWTTGLVALFLLILPVWLGIFLFDFSVRQAWLCVLVFIFMLFLVTMLRYRQGRWQSMLVIEEA